MATDNHQENEKSPEKSSRLTEDDKFIAIIIALCLIGTPFISIYWDNMPPVIIATFLGIAVAALLYRFLGGIEKASFTLGMWKVTGSAAVLIGFSWWANTQIVDYKKQQWEQHSQKDDMNISRQISPRIGSWYALDKKTGIPVDIIYEKTNTKLSANDPDGLSRLRSDRTLSLQQDTDGSYDVTYKSNGDTSVLGNLSRGAVKSAGIGHSYTISLDPYEVIKMGPGSRADVSRALPFILKTGTYSENYTRFTLVSRDGNRSRDQDGSILLRNAKIFTFNDKKYLIAVIEVNHQSTDIDKIYSRFYIAEISAKML